MVASAETKERGEERRGRRGRRGRREDSHRSIVVNRRQALYLGPDSSADSASEQTVTAGDGGTWKNKNASWLAGSETHEMKQREILNMARNFRGMLNATLRSAKR